LRFWSICGVRLMTYLFCTWNHSPKSVPKGFLKINGFPALSLKHKVGPRPTTILVFEILSMIVVCPGWGMAVLQVFQNGHRNVFNANRPTVQSLHKKLFHLSKRHLKMYAPVCFLYVDLYILHPKVLLHKKGTDQKGGSM